MVSSFAAAAHTGQSKDKAAKRKSVGNYASKLGMPGALLMAPMCFFAEKVAHAMGGGCTIRGL